MTTSFNQGSKKVLFGCQGKCKFFLDGQAHFEADLPIGWRVKAVVSDDLAVKSFTETYKQWPLASKKFVKSSKGKVAFKFFSSKPCT